MAMTPIQNLQKVQTGSEVSRSKLKSQVNGAGPSFANTFREALGKGQLHQPGIVVDSGLKFSNHAVERMHTRGIRFTPEQLHRIGTGARKAASKGAKETLVLMDDSALIVSQKNNTVVTVMDKAALKENVFTNIDSTVVVQQDVIRRLYIGS